jgi:dTDP-4-dehydrorhamnose 3,5-epimerase
MKLIPTELPGVVIVEPAVFGDDRGWFMESFNSARLDAALVALGLPATPTFVQDNHSCSQSGVLRGLHYQLPPHAQGKLVRVVQGAAWDVAVDIRRGSPAFGRWVGVELTAQNHRQLWIPPGFAHGFVALTDDTHFLYKTTDVYAKDCERSIRWDDPALAIQWPLPKGMAPRLAPKDAAAPLLADAEVFVEGA